MASKLEDSFEQEICKKLETLFTASDDFVELEQNLKKFCPFEALGASRVEVRHSNFLSYILDPHRPHGYGDRALRAVLLEVVKEADFSDHLSALDIHIIDLSGTEIRREWHSIDLLINVPAAKIVFAFELKIDAKKHGDQLARYKKTVNEHWPASDGWQSVFVFLRPTDEMADEDGWSNVKYEPIVRGLTRVATILGADPFAAQMLLAYAAMMRRHFLGEDRLQALSTSLWNTHREALEFLLENKPDIVSDFLNGVSKRAEELATNASCPGITIVPDKSTRNRTRLGIEEWQRLPDGRSSSAWTDSKSVFLIEIARFDQKNGFGVKIGLVLGPSASPMRQKWFDAIQPLITSSRGKKMSLDNKWKWVDTHLALQKSDFEDKNDDEQFAKLQAALSNFVRERLFVFGQKIEAASKTALSE